MAEQILPPSPSLGEGLAIAVFTAKPWNAAPQSVFQQLHAASSLMPEDYEAPSLEAVPQRYKAKQITVDILFLLRKPCQSLQLRLLLLQSLWDAATALQHRATVMRQN